MKPIVYTFGYDGWGPHVELMKRVFIKYNENFKGKSLRWIDIRLNRKVRAEGFKEGGKLLKSKKFYCHIKELGNEGINEGKIRIANLKEGNKKLEAEIKKAKEENVDLILFCHCEEYIQCHRKTVVNKTTTKIKKYFYKNKQTKFPEWPPLLKKKIILTGKKGIKMTKKYVHIPSKLKIEGYSSPFIIPPGSTIELTDNKNGKRILKVARVIPSADEKYARVLFKE